MADKILLKRSYTTGSVPTAQDLDFGEVAINTADQLIYTKHSNGDVVTLGGGSGDSTDTVATSFAVVQLSGDNETTTFDIGVDFVNEDKFTVYIDGVYQQKNAYTFLDQTITFSEAPPEGTDNIEVVYLFNYDTVASELAMFGALDDAEAARDAAIVAQAASEAAQGSAETSATNAATSESNAATSASTASTAASNAAISATTASTAATNAETAYDNFDDRYLGAKATDPALDNDGDALITGALYFNSTTNEMKVYTGSAWVAAYVTLGDALISSNNLSDLDSASTARTNLGLGSAATTDSTAYATSAQGTSADTAFSWGDHSLVGYVQPNDNVALGELTVTNLVDTVYTLTGIDIDPANGNVQTKALSADTTFTESLVSGESVVLMLTGGDTHTITFPTITWTGSTGNTAPTLTASDAIVFWKVSSTLYGAYVGSYA